MKGQCETVSQFILSYFKNENTKEKTTMGQ